MLKFRLSIFILVLTVQSSYASASNNVVPPDTTTLIDKTSAILMIEEGKSLFNEGKVRDALVRFRQSSVKDPNNWKSAYWISQCHYQMNNFGLALKYAQDAVSLDKNEVDRDVYELIGRAYHRMGNVDSAIVHYNKAISMLSTHRVKELKLELRVKQCMFAKSQFDSGKKNQTKSLKSLNTGYNEYCPIITNGGKTIYFVSRRSDTKGGNMNPDDQEYFEDTYIGIWNSAQNDWDSVSNDLSRVNSEGFDAITYVSKDGLQGLMTINTTALNTKNTTKSSDIFTIELSSKNKWSTPKRITNKSINTSYFDGSATMTDDMNTMYFVSDRRGDKSGTDIYVVHRDGKSWGEATPLASQINTSGNETTPFITGDGRYLFFSSDGLEGMGGYDIYVVENLGDSWGTPVNLGIAFNSVNNDTHFQYYPELNKAVLAGFEIIGQKASMDIYEIDMSTFEFPKGE
jgi:tetratricopeptide (TPR) repeat protein